MAASEINTIFGGTWVVDRSDNFEKYLDAAGVGFMKKKMALSQTPKLTITVEGDTITVSISIAIKTMTTSFKLGEDYDVEGEIPGKGNTTYADGNLTTKVTPKDSKKTPQTVTREIKNGELVQTMVLGDVTASRTFKKV